MCGCVGVMVEAVASAALATVQRFDSTAKLGGIVKCGLGSKAIKLDLAVSTGVAMAATQAVRLQLPFHNVILSENASTGACQIQVLVSQRSAEITAAAGILENTPAFKALEKSSKVFAVLGLAVFVFQAASLALLA